MLTKGSFTRCDEWSNLLRLFNIMNFSLCSRSQFRSIEKANTMPKRNQETKTRKEPAVAKPRPACLISGNLLNVEQASSLGSDASNVPRTPQLESKSVLGSTWKHVQDRTSNVFSREEGRQSVSRKPLETAAGY